MDLMRYRLRFPEENLDSLVRGAVEFIQKNNVDSHWGENQAKKYGLGFWAEAVYQRYSLAPDGRKLSDLDGIIIKLKQSI